MLLLCSIVIHILLFVSEIKHVPLVWYGDIQSRKHSNKICTFMELQRRTQLPLCILIHIRHVLASSRKVFSSYSSIEKQRKIANFNTCIHYFPLILKLCLCFLFFFYSEFDAKIYSATLKCRSTYSHQSKMQIYPGYPYEITIS